MPGPDDGCQSSESGDHYLECLNRHAEPPQGCWMYGRRTLASTQDKSREICELQVLVSGRKDYSKCERPSMLQVQKTG